MVMRALSLRLEGVEENLVHVFRARRGPVLSLLIGSTPRVSEDTVRRTNTVITQSSRRLNGVLPARVISKPMGWVFLDHVFTASGRLHSRFRLSFKPYC